MKAADDKRALCWLAAIGAAIAALTLLTPAAFKAGGDNYYMAMTIPAGLLAIAAARIADRAPATQALWLIFGLAIAMRAALLTHEPLLSTDIYRYVWDGRVQAAGINPYRYAPADAALAALRDQVIYPNINRADYAVTIYPPVAEMFFLIVTRLGETVTAMRIALLACEALTVALIVLLLRRLGQPPTRVVAYAWHPLAMWEIANSGHVDALMIALMMLGLWFAMRNRPLKAAASIALGALVKPFAALALPSAWRPWDWRAPCVVATIAAVCYAPYLTVGSGVLGFLAAGYLDEEGIATGQDIWPLAIWRLIAGQHRGDALIYFAGAALGLFAFAFRIARGNKASPGANLSDINKLLLAFLFLLSPNYPWYFLMVTPFVALCGGAPTWTASIAALLLQEEAGWGEYVSLFARKSILYGAMLLACAWSIWIARRKRNEMT